MSSTQPVKPAWLSQPGNQRMMVGGSAAIFALNRVGRARENLRYGEYGSAMMNAGLAGAAGLASYHTFANTAHMKQYAGKGADHLTNLFQKQASQGRNWTWASNAAKFLRGLHA